MNDLTGKYLGRYHILEQLGEGGMAVVYKAYDTHLGHEVAVKVIRLDNLPRNAEERALKRFEREAKAVARLDHANIVKVTDYGEHEGSPYLVMPYVPGGTLKQYLKEHGSMDWREATRMLKPVAEALAYAHEQGLIHRDVKPSNILLTTRGEPMLTDFGVAKVLDDEVTQDLTGTSATVGTPEYMAPEQVVSKSVDQRADIYALGVVYYEMVTGRRPYEADTPMAVLFKHASAPLPRPKDLVPDLPDVVEQVLLKALAKRPEDRYQNMREIINAMELIRKNNSIPSAFPMGEIEVGVVSNIGKQSEGSKRKRLLGVLLGIVALSGIITLLISGNKGGWINIQTDSSDIEAESSIKTNVSTDAQKPIPSTISRENLDLVERIAQLGKGQIESLNISPDGNFAAISSPSGIWLLNLDDLRLAQKISEDSVDNVIFTQSDSLLSIKRVKEGEFIKGYSITSEGNFKIEELFQISDNSKDYWYELEGYSNACDWLILSRSDDILEIWDFGSGEIVFQFDVYENHGAKINDDCTRMAVASGYDGEALLFDLNSRQVISTLNGHTDAVMDFEFTPDNKFLLSAGRKNQVVKWDAITGEYIQEFKEIGNQDEGFLSDYEGDFVSVDINSTGELVVVSGDYGKVVVFTMDTGEIIASKNFSTGYIYSYFHLENNRIILNDYQSIWSWDISTDLIINNDDFTGFSQFIAVSNDSKLLAVSSSSEIQVWDINAYELVVEINQAGVSGLSFNPTNNSLGASIFGKYVNIWDIPSGELIAQMGKSEDEEDMYYEYWYNPAPLMFLPDGKLVTPIDKKGEMSWYGTITEDSGEGTVSLVFNGSGLSLAVWEIGSVSPIVIMDSSNFNTENLYNALISSFSSIQYLPSENAIAALASQIINIQWDFENDVVVMWDLESGNITNIWPTNPEGDYEDGQLFVNPQEKQLISIFPQEIVLKMDYMTKDIQQLNISEVASGCDGSSVIFDNLLITCGYPFVVLDLYESKSVELTEIRGYVGAITPDGTKIVSGRDGQIEIWGVRDY